MGLRPTQVMKTLWGGRPRPRPTLVWPFRSAGQPDEGVRRGPGGSPHSVFNPASNWRVRYSRI